MAAASAGHTSDGCSGGFKGDDRLGPAVRKNGRLADDHRLDVVANRASFAGGLACSHRKPLFASIKAHR